jgi:glycerol-3-phosphate dehydrogenase
MKLRAAITAYEKLGAVADADRHQNWSRDDMAREEPLLVRERYGHACVYREYLTDDARLVLANLRAAAGAGAGAAVASFAPVESLILEGERAAGVLARCTRTGRTLRVRARCVINAAGPWVDLVKQIEEPEAAPRLHISKGVHIVLPAERLPVRHMFFINADDRRSIFVIRRGGCVYIGTTDTTYEPGTETWPSITREDVEYLLAPLARDFTVAPPRAEEVVAAWAGLRPLIAEPGKKPAEISRRDEVWVGSRGVITVAGGKLTGFRLMARETLEKAAQASGLRLAPPAREEAPLPGGDFSGEVDALAAKLGDETGLDAASAGRLARLYGSEAGNVVALGADALVPGAPLVTGEVDWAVRVEAATSLEDVLYRRTRCALYEPSAREAAVAPIAERMAALLGWDEARRSKEERETRARLVEELAFAGSRR